MRPSSPAGLRRLAGPLAAALAASLGLLACTAPDRLAAGVCGNGVVEPGEACEYYPDQASGQPCNRPGNPVTECRLACDPAKATTELQCPTGQVCSPTGACYAQANACGNGAVEPGEDCESLLPAVPGGTCAPPGAAHACRFTCDPANTTTAQCPTGYACAADGVCESASNACGNGVVEPGEACEPTVAQAQGTCASTGPNRCQFVCDGGAACPTGSTCGADDRCRTPGGAFVPTASFSAQYDYLAVGDLNGDGAPDLVTGDNAGVSVAYGTGHGEFPDRTSFPISLVTAPAVADLDADGRADLALESFTGISLFRGQADKTVLGVPVNFKANSWGDKLGGDLYVPVRPSASQPYQHALHVSQWSDKVILAFDRDRDPSPVTIPGVHSDGFTNVLRRPAFPAAEIDVDPAAGGEEIAVSFVGESVIRFYTARRVLGTDGKPVPSLAPTPITLNLPGNLELPPWLADLDGDGAMDVVAVVSSGTTRQTVIALGDGAGGFTQVFADPSFGHLGIDPVAVGTRAEQFGASFILYAESTSGVVGYFLCDRPGPGQASLQCRLMPYQVAVDQYPEAVFGDFNRDGYGDFAGAVAHGVGIALGGPTGIFNYSFVATQASPKNLRVGDFDGDLTEDVLFESTDADGLTSVSVLFGATSGPLQPPTTMTTYPKNGRVGFAEGMLLDEITSDATTDVIVSSKKTQDDYAMLVTVLYGDGSRHLQSVIGLNLKVPYISFGAYTAGFPFPSLYLPAQRLTPPPALHVSGVFDVRTDDIDGFLEHDYQCDAFASDALFDANQATAYASGDLDGDHLDDVVAVHSDAGETALPKLLVLHTSAPTTSLPVALTTTLRGVRRSRMVDVDVDGKVDLVAVFAGDCAKDAAGACTASYPASGVAVLFGDGARGLSMPTVIQPPDGAGQVWDAASLNLDGDPEPELVIATEAGLYYYDLTPATRAFAVRPGAGLPFDATPGMTASYQELRLQPADLDRDGVSDLVVDEFGTAYVFRGTPAP